MAIVSILAMAAILVAACSGLYILNKEYLPLLIELERTKKTLKTVEEHKNFVKGRR